MSEKYTYRKITEADLDMLYALPDAKEALVPIRGDRDIADFLIGWSVAVCNDTNQNLYCLGTSMSSESTMKYLYFHENKLCTLIETDGGWELSIFYCSEDLRKDLESIKTFVSETLICSGEFLTGEVRFIPAEGTYTFIESKNTYQF